MQLIPRVLRARAAVLSALGAVVLWELIVDPYFWWRDSTDFLIPAPFWQRGLGFVEIALLLLAASALFRSRDILGQRLVVAETLARLLSTILLVQRDGVARFIGGFGAEEFLSWHLLAIGCRVLILALLFESTRSDGERVGAHRGL